MARDMETSKIIDGVLRTLVVTGMLGCIVVAPNALKVGDVLLRHLDKRSRARTAGTLARYMFGQQLVTYRQLPDGDYEITITEKGRQRLKKSEFDNLSIERPKQWDGKWRLVLFDVPDVRKKSRRDFSRKLQAMGFYQLQKSAWVVPYPCEKEVNLIRQVFEVDPHDVIVAELARFGRENTVKRHFQIA